MHAMSDGGRGYGDDAPLDAQAPKRRSKQHNGRGKGARKKFDNSLMYTGKYEPSHHQTRKESAVNSILAHSELQVRMRQSPYKQTPKHTGSRIPVLRTPNTPPSYGSSSKRRPTSNYRNKHGHGQQNKYSTPHTNGGHVRSGAQRNRAPRSLLPSASEPALGRYYRNSRRHTSHSPPPARKAPATGVPNRR